MRDPAIAERGATGAVGDQDGMFRTRHFDIVERDVLHQLGRVDALLIARADEIVERQAGDRHHRRAVHIGVVQTVEQMHRPRPGGADADPEPSGVLGEAGSHEGRRFLMPDADVADAILTFAQRLDDRVDAIADDA